MDTPSHQCFRFCHGPSPLRLDPINHCVLRAFPNLVESVLFVSMDAGCVPVHSVTWALANQIKWRGTLCSCPGGKIKTKEPKGSFSSQLCSFPSIYEIPSTMGVIPLIRQIVLGVTTLFSIVELAVSASLISQTEQYYGATAVFCVLGVAVAVISLVTLPVMLVVDIMRRGAFTSMIAVELGWLSILWILWVAVAGETAYQVGGITSFGCTYVNTIVNGMCQQIQAVEAFSFLNFIIILLYTCFLFVVTMVAANRGQSVWLSSVKNSFGSPTGSVEHPMTQYNNSAPPQPQVYPTGTPDQSQYAASPTQPAAARPAITV